MKIIKRDLNSFVGKKFEDISRVFLIQMNIKGLLPFKFSNIGTWWEKDKEIDIVSFDKKEKEILFCEFKWQDLGEKEAEEIIESIKEKC